MSENFICPLPSLQNSKTSLPVNIQTSPPSLIPLIPQPYSSPPKPYSPLFPNFIPLRPNLIHTRERNVYFISEFPIYEEEQIQKSKPTPWLLFLLLHLLLYTCGFYQKNIVFFPMGLMAYFFLGVNDISGDKDSPPVWVVGFESVGFESWLGLNALAQDGINRAVRQISLR